jgi:hypothetical protein
LLIEKGIFLKEEFLEREMVKAVDGEMNRKKSFDSESYFTGGYK